jgi:multidrug efflux pump
VIVGGVGLSTLLTTLVVPSLYLLIGGFSKPSNHVADLIDRLRASEKRPDGVRSGEEAPVVPAE